MLKEGLPFLTNW